MFTKDNPAIIALVAGLQSKVAEYRTAAEQYGANSTDPSFSAVLALPLSNVAEANVKGVDDELKAIVEMIDSTTDQGDESVYAHYANMFQTLADHYKKLATDWAPSLLKPTDAKPLSLEDVQNLASECDTVFQSILAMCTDLTNTDDADLVADVVGVKIAKRTYKDKVGFTLDIPRFRQPRNEAKVSGKLAIVVDGVRPNGDTLERQTLQAFSKPAKDILAMFHDKGVKFASGNHIVATINGDLFTINVIEA